MELQNLADNRKFRKTFKPVFTDKVQVSQSITLIGNGEMFTDDLKIAEIFNDDRVSQKNCLTFNHMLKNNDT